METIKEAIKNKEFYHHFQPIFDIKDWKIIGYESFLRSDNRPKPEIVFEEARKEEQLYEMDTWSIYQAIDTYQRSGSLKKEGLLFLNIFPSTILNDQFPAFIKKIMLEFSLTSEQVVFEILEAEVITEMDKFKERIVALKNQGFLIAVDDMGKDQTCLKLIIEIEPHFIKLDRYFAKDMHLSPKKQAIIKLFIDYCRQFDIKFILEGVENPKEIAMAKALEVPYCQGFVLGEPEEVSKGVLISSLPSIRR